MLFTSILKDIAEETIPKTSAVPKRFNLKKGQKLFQPIGQGFSLLVPLRMGALTKLSPFAVQKAIVGLAGEPKSVNKIKIGC